MTVYQDCRWWLMAINSWCRDNNDLPYDFEELNENKEMWHLLRLYKKKVGDVLKLPAVLDWMASNGMFEKGGILSRYAVACLDAVMKDIKESEAVYAVKQEQAHKSLRDIDKWRQDKKEHPEKYAPPEDLQDLIKKIGE